MRYLIQTGGETRWAATWREATELLHFFATDTSVSHVIDRETGRMFSLERGWQ